ncbi:MAG TPA: lipopolysaccharide biosynthesis protein, partial [Blastocatellia bacterium]|nr:lipopolysaccharide biosynthesis protein [Blastocatellia bacterium]
VPRLMGPDIYGRYALMPSVSMWFALLSGMSSIQVMSRFVPHLAVQGDKEGLQRFFGNFLIVRLTNGTLAASLYFLLTVLWFPELDLPALAIISGAVLFRTLSKLTFALFLGLNQAARWGMGETVNRWTALILIVPGIYFAGLRGACLALLLAELTVLVIGISWARPYLAWSKIRFEKRYIAPYLRFGLFFFGSSMILSFSQHSGEMLVRVVSGDYVQVGYFGLAYRIYYTAVVAMWQFTLAFGPLLTMLLAEGQTEDLKRWVERLLKWMAVGGVLAFSSAVFLGDDLVPLALGAEYRPVAGNLVLLMLALLTYSLGSVARLLALTYDRPGVALKAALIHLIGFIGTGAPLVAWRGSLAGCMAVLIATTLYAGYFTWRMRGVVGYSIWKWALPILLGGLFLPLALLRSSWPVNTALFGIYVTGYASLLLLLKIVSPGEIAWMRRAVRPGAATTGHDDPASFDLAR